MKYFLLIILYGIMKIFIFNRCVLNKIILEKNIPEELVADKFIELKSKKIYSIN